MAQRVAASRGPGRPRGFDRTELVDASVDVFWKYGLSGTTTRVLEHELGVSQSSLYNTYGSKEQLLEESIERYESRMAESVLSTLDGTGKEALLNFIDSGVRWIGRGDHRGCLILNLAAEDIDYGHWLKAYRAKLRKAVKPNIAAFTKDKETVASRTDLLVAAVLGLNIAAQAGAGPAEIKRLANSIKEQVSAW